MSFDLTVGKKAQELRRRQGFQSTTVGDIIGCMATMLSFRNRMRKQRSFMRLAFPSSFHSLIQQLFTEHLLGIRV